MITSKDFDRGKLSPLDAEAHMTGLGPDGTYGGAPEIDVDLARANYPILFGLDSPSHANVSPETPYGVNPKIREEQNEREIRARTGLYDANYSGRKRR